MYKVILVDDESVIRQGLKKLIDWQSYGFMVIDEAEDGISALEKIIYHKPDLILLDIRMPGYDGVTLLKMIRDKGIDCKVIFLTGYAEFKYAQKAIELDVDAFLTKPINEVELQQFLVTITKKLNKEQYMTECLTTQQMLEKKQMFRRLLFGQDLEDSEDNDESSEYIVVEVQFNEDIKVVNEFFDAYQCDNDQVICLLVAGTWVLIFNNLSISRIKVALYDLSNDMKKQFNDEFFISVGRQVKGYHAIYKSFLDVKVLGQRWFLNDNQSIIYFQEQTQDNGKHLFIDNDLLFSYIEIDNSEGIANFFEELEHNIRKRNMNFNKVKGLCSNCLLIINERIQQKYQGESQELSNNKTISEEIYKHERLSVLINYLKQQVMLMQKSIHNGSVQSTMKRLLDYIDNHYDKDLKLERLGAIFGYNSSYLGTIFKEYSGMSFTKYLDITRIEVSKKLLLEQDSKVYEIANLVGYNSVDYFHGKFKKYVEMSPKQYQIMHKNKKES